jgi:putative hydrolase of the HAD superfamily
MGIHLTDEEVNELGMRCTQALRKFLSMDDDAVEVVHALAKAGFKLGLVSNTPFPAFAIDDFLQFEGLFDYFPIRVYSSAVRYMKPQRRIFRLALDQLGVAPEKILFVGDRVDKDVKGPARVGMRTALLAKNGRVIRGRVRPDHIISRLTEVPAILQA